MNWYKKRKEKLFHSGVWVKLSLSPDYSAWLLCMTEQVTDQRECNNYLNSEIILNFNILGVLRMQLKCRISRVRKVITLPTDTVSLECNYWEFNFILSSTSDPSVVVRCNINKKRKIEMNFVHGKHHSVLLSLNHVPLFIPYVKSLSFQVEILANPTNKFIVEERTNLQISYASRVPG